MTLHTKHAGGLEYGRKNAGHDGDVEDMARQVKRAMDDAKNAVVGMKAITEDHASRLTDVEQKLARRGNPGGPDRGETWGEKLTESEGFKGFVAGGLRGTARAEVKALTSVAGSGGALVAPDRRPEIVALAQRPMTVRALLAPGDTASNLIQFVRQTVRTNAAAPVAENTLKPESVLTYVAAEAPVRTIAHWIPISRQLFDDVPALRSTIDGELTYGLDEAEERQLLFGDGTGENLFGIVPQATPYDTTLTRTGDTKADVLLRAIGQAELALLPATGMVLNTLDWIDLVGLKDTTGSYLGGGPFASEQLRRVWALPAAVTPVMPRGRFLIGSFALAAQIFDRMQAEVLVSSEDRDNFVKNMLTARAEKRLALAVKRPQALITGAFPA